MKKYGFFGGSFNPVTNAHINLAQLVVEKYGLDKLVFVPVGSKYKKAGLIDEKHRYKMLNIATKDKPKLEVSDIELYLEKALTTLEVFQKIEKEYKEVKPYFIIGADNLSKILQSEDCKTLVKNYEYIVIDRQGVRIAEQITLYPILRQNKERFHMLEDNPYVDISATIAREFIQNMEKDKIENIIPKEVYQYIQDNELYK